MITSCKEYVYKEGGSSIWDMDRSKLIRKLLECVKLNEAYQRCFHDVKVRSTKFLLYTCFNDPTEKTPRNAQRKAV
jgi:hypothetical protein